MSCFSNSKEVSVAKMESPRGRVKIDETAEGNRNYVVLICHVQEGGFIQSIIGRHWTFLSKE